MPNCLFTNLFTYSHQQLITLQVGLLLPATAPLSHVRPVPVRSSWKVVIKSAASPSPSPVHIVTALGIACVAANTAAIQSLPSCNVTRIYNYKIHTKSIERCGVFQVSTAA